MYTSEALYITFKIIIICKCVMLHRLNLRLYETLKQLIYFTYLNFIFIISDYNLIKWLIHLKKKKLKIMKWLRWKYNLYII